MILIVLTMMKNHATFGVKEAASYPEMSDRTFAIYICARGLNNF